VATLFNNLQINKTFEDIVANEFVYTALLVFCGGSEIRTKASVAILMFDVLVATGKSNMMQTVTAAVVVIVMVTNYGRLDEP
jgi:hypothetical protein